MGLIPNETSLSNIDLLSPAFAVCEQVMTGPN